MIGIVGVIILLPLALAGLLYGFARFADAAVATLVHQLVSASPVTHAG
jgi:hypothetical protein